MVKLTSYYYFTVYQAVKKHLKKTFPKNDFLKNTSFLIVWMIITSYKQILRRADTIICSVSAVKL